MFSHLYTPMLHLRGENFFLLSSSLQVLTYYYNPHSLLVLMECSIFMNLEDSSNLFVSKFSFNFSITISIFQSFMSYPWVLWVWTLMAFQLDYSSLGFIGFGSNRLSFTSNIKCVILGLFDQGFKYHYNSIRPNKTYLILYL